MSSRIRICIGTEDKTKIPCEVLKYSILKHASSPANIDFHELNGTSWKSAKDRPFQIGTGFSLFRWYIPEMFDYQGYAIYLDADQIVLSDIQELWQSDQLYPNKNASIWCTYQNLHFETSVMFIDCAKAKDQWPNQKTIEAKLKNDQQRNYYRSLMWAKEIKFAPQVIPNYWNALNSYEKDTRLIHYTIEATQPWYDPTHPLTAHWKRMLREAVEAGKVSLSDIRAACQQWKPRDKEAGTRHEGMNPMWGEYCGQLPVKENQSVPNIETSVHPEDKEPLNQSTGNDLE